MIALSISGITILFLPDNIAENMYITDLRQEFGVIIGFSVIIVSSILIVNLGFKVIQVIVKVKKKRTFLETL